MEYYSYLYEPVSAKINNVSFCIMSKSDILLKSVLKGGHGIESSEIHFDNKPKKGGLNDMKLGINPSDNNICETCGFTRYCPGHFGHIILNEYIYNILYLNFIKKILDVICIKCSKLIIKNDEVLQIDKKHRLNYLKNYSKNIMLCGNCGSNTKKIIVDIKKSTGNIHIYSEKKKVKQENVPNNKEKTLELLKAEVIFEKLKNISDEDCMYMGMNYKKSRPENMIFTVFPIPPVQIRPSVPGNFIGVSYSDDMLTNKLSDIFKANKRMGRFDKLNHKNYQNLLQYQITSYIDNDAITVNKVKNFKSISCRIKGKYGLIRSNLMGKRLNFSARTVITPDPSINSNEVGIPVKIAMILTIPEIVNKKNIEKMYKLLKNRSKEYPGANAIYIKKSKSLINIEYLQKNIKLEYGDIVERHLTDGDWVLFNRQPTLHKESMMAHKIKIIDNPDLMTYRLSPAITTPYNADFDGDEMNIFIPRNIQTMYELKYISNVNNHFISPTSKSIIGIVQDALLGSYNLSTNDKINWQDCMNIISSVKLDDYSIKKENITGYELFSKIIPNKINIDNNDIKIINGKFNHGKLNKSLLGANKLNTIHGYIWNQYDEETTKRFIDNIQRLVNNFNIINGFTVGYNDLKINDDVKININKIFETNIIEISHMITDIERSYDFNDVESFDRKIFEKLNKIRTTVSQLIMNNIPDNNNFSIMINSGSKGSILNIGQMIGCVGLQAFEENIISKKYNGRTSAYFHKHDDRPYSRGLIKNSFINGLNFSEFVFHMLTSREGLIDSSVKTADTGYIQRKLIKYLEDILIKYDCTIRNAKDDLISISYGSNSTKNQIYDIKFLVLSDNEIKEKYKFIGKHNNEYIRKIIKLKNKQIYNNSISTWDYSKLNTKFKMFINIDIILNEFDKNIDNFVSPDYVYEEINKLLKNKNTNLLCMEENDILKISDEKIYKHIFKMIIYDNLSPNYISKKYNQETFDKIINKIKDTYNDNIIQPGEMIGIISAQNMGEPLTQMSCHKDTMILVKKNDKITYLKISKLIDNILKDFEFNKNMIVDINDIEIMSINNEKESEWKFISQVSRHPTNGKLIKIITESDRETITTLSHSHLQLRNDEIIPIKASELKIGDKIPVLTFFNNKNELGDISDYINGYDLGFYGNIFENNIFNETQNYISGFLKGYIEKKNKSKKNIIIESAYEEEINIISILLSYFKIFGTFNKYKNNKISYTISKKDLKYLEPIDDKYKFNNEIKDVYWDAIIKIEIFEEDGFVYDFTVPGNDNFMVDNNILVHNTLNSFHHSGIAYSSTIIHGIPRVKEILNVSKKIKTPQMIIYLNPNVDYKLAKSISNIIIYVVLKDIRKELQVYYEPFYDAENNIMSIDDVSEIYYEDNISNGCQNNINGLPWLIRIRLDKSKMLDKEITLMEIKQKICNMWKNRFIENIYTNKIVKKVLNKIYNIAIISTKEDNLNPYLHIRFNAKDYNNSQFTKKTINNFIDYFIDNFKIRGVENINSNYNIVKEKDIDISNYTIYIDGNNLIDIRYIKNINLLKTISNNIYDVYKIFGIEIARNLMINELFLAYKRGDHHIDFQILSLLVDKMTFTGDIVSIDRHGLSKSNKDPISKASFEKTIEHFKNAAFYDISDNLECISSRIAVGQIINGGTGLCDILLDIDKILYSEILEDDEIDNLINLDDNIKVDNNFADIFIPE